MDTIILVVAAAAALSTVDAVLLLQSYTVRYDEKLSIANVGKYFFNLTTI